jgi:hypothetical protein
MLRFLGLAPPPPALEPVAPAPDTVTAEPAPAPQASDPPATPASSSSTALKASDWVRVTKRKPEFQQREDETHEELAERIHDEMDKAHARGEVRSVSTVGNIDRRLYDKDDDRGVQQHESQHERSRKPPHR